MNNYNGNNDNHGWLLNNQVTDIYDNTDMTLFFDNNMFNKPSIIDRLFKVKNNMLIPISVYIYNNLCVFVSRRNIGYLIKPTKKISKYINYINKNKLVIKYMDIQIDDTNKNLLVLFSCDSLRIITKFSYKCL